MIRVKAASALLCGLCALPLYAAEYTFDETLLLGSGYGEGIARLNEDNQPVAGQYSADVWLNGTFVSQRDVLFVADKSGGVQPCLPEGFWQEQGVTTNVSTQADCYIPAERVSGGDWHFDQATLRLDVSVPQALLKQTPRDYVAPTLWDSGESLLFMNYNAHYYRNDNGGRKSDYAWLGLTAGLNVGAWQLRRQSSATWRRYQGESRQQWDNLQSWLQRPIARLESMLTAGESYTSGNLLGSVAFTGVRLETDQRMWPQSRRGYAPDVRGTARSPSRVVIKQNGRTLYETSVPEGPFVINDLPDSSWNGDLQVEITGADGQVSGFTVPWASVPLALRPGVWRYSAVVGRARDYPATRNTFADLTLERGIANMLTANGGVRIGDDYQALVGGGVLATRAGAFGMDATYSQSHIADEKLRGWRIQTQWSKTFLPTNTHVTLAGYRYSTEGYRDFGDVLGQRSAQKRGNTWRSDTLNQRNQFTLTVNQTLGEYGNLWLSGSVMDYYSHRGRNTQLQMGYGTTLAGVSFNIALSRQDAWWRYRNNEEGGSSRQGQKENIATLTLSVPVTLGQHEHYASFSASQAKRSGRSSQVSLAGALNEAQTLNYALSSGWQQGRDGSSAQTDWSGSLQQMTSSGSLNTSYARSRDYQQWTAGGRGALVVHREGVVTGPWLGETFALVKAPGAEGAKVSGSQGATVNSRGFALVPSLTPYRYNTISLDGTGMDSQAELQESQRRIAPMAGAAVKLTFATLRGHALLISVSGKATLIPGEQVRDAQGKVIGMVGQGNQVYARVAESEGALHIAEGCTLRWKLSAAQRKEPLIALKLPCEQG
ncbi:fimbria/pilus outer membrane usher protein [Phytobacter sp. RSE-02]|uniref:fimbria/pilus outer membrane usher protein n=1 Tax=Phytobacter sp. RSE-02 TaxID=3229229 RepID=UPI00339D630D